MRKGAKGATTVIDVAISVGAGDKRHCEKTTQHERKNSPQSSTEKGNMAVTSMDRVGTLTSRTSTKCLHTLFKLRWTSTEKRCSSAT